MIRIFVIEDHPVMITGLRNLFKPSRDNIDFVGGANNLDDIVNRADPSTFDLFLLDLWIPYTHPLLNVKKLKEHFPGKPFVIYTSENSQTWQRKMFEAGAMAYILKSTNKYEIKTTLEKVMEGKIVFDEGMIEPNYEKKLAAVLSGKKYQLTSNQQEMVILLSSGLTQQQIADSRKTKVSTVERTLKQIRNKFDAKTDAELVKILLEKGII